jgi:diguanylate cyclase (GGDEF)-like protein
MEADPSRVSGASGQWGAASADSLPLVECVADGSYERSVQIFEEHIAAGHDGVAQARCEVAYIWDIGADEVRWEDSAEDVLGILQPEMIRTGEGFNSLLAPEHLERRRLAFSSHSGEDLGSGVPYKLQFRFLPKGLRSSASIWLEDQGRWWGGEDGRPALARGVLRIVNESFREQQRQLYSGDHDELTGQLNRVRLTEALSAVIERVHTTGQSCAFLIASINNLAVINEAFGFDVGDSVVTTVGQTLHGHMRGGDSIGRFSSNKFGIILNDCRPEAMQIAAERLIRAVRDTRNCSSASPMTATLSIGGVLIPECATSVNAAVSGAMQALDMAKARKHDNFVAYEHNPSRETARRRNITIADEVISALDEDRMRLVLQPIVCSKTHEVSFYEALMRMEQPDGSVISAGEFVEVAERLGLSRLIDRRTLELAIDLLKRDRNLRLSLNVSGLTCGDNEWVACLRRLVGSDEQQQLVSRLIIEITETAAIEDLDQSIAFVDTLKELGCKVAIDDFGAGYTSFKHLKHLAVDIVKIDGAFVRNLLTDPSDEVFLRTMVELARNFDMATVAEWVGCEEVARIVADVGITYMQGYHFGRPVSAEAVLSGPLRSQALG